MNNPDWYLALTVGLMLGAARFAGALARMLHLPRVTAYLLVGLALGPHTPITGLIRWLGSLVGATQGEPSTFEAWHIPEAHLEYLHPVGEFAISLVLFNMGCHFPIARFRRILTRLLPMSLGELGMTLLVVTGGLLCLGVLFRDWGMTWQLAVLFGALALATAPATTVLVLKENHSEGPLTEFTTGLVVLNNLAAIVIFEILFVLVYATRTPDVSIGLEYLELARKIAVAGALGVSAGLVASFFCGIVRTARWLVLLIAILVPLLAVCKLYDFSYLIAFLVMGTAVSSTSDVADEIVAVLDRLTGLTCVVFFVIHGAEMNLASLWAAGALGVAYIALRSCGKYLGVYLTANAHRDGPQVKRWLGTALLSQAGAAITLAGIAYKRDSALGGQLQDIILGTVVFFEIAGPLLVSRAVLQAGEVPVSDAIYHTASSPFDQLRGMLFRILKSFGFNPLRGSRADQLDVSRVTRRNVKALDASTLFGAVLDHIEHSHDNTYPVVNKANELIGIIRYPDVRDVIFEPTAQSLVTAEDLAVPVKELLAQNDTLEDAWDLLKHNEDDCVPVVAGDEKDQFLGIVRRRDLLRLLSYDETREPERKDH